MLASLAGLQIGRHEVALAVSPDYRQAATISYDIMIGGLKAQTLLLAVTAVIMALINWLTGSSRPARKLKAKWTLLAAKLHRLVLGGSNAAIYGWTAKYKPALEWALLAISVVILFAGRLTVSRLLWCLAGLIAAVLVVEIAAQPAKRHLSTE
jgi:hypothetical protein